MSAAFLGLRVSVQLHQGGQREGIIVDVDAATGTLTLRQGQTATKITRNEIANLQILPEQGQQQGASSSSSSSLGKAEPAATASHAASRSSVEPPSAPAAMLQQQQRDTPKKAPKAPKASKKNGSSGRSAHVDRHVGSHASEQSDLEEDFDFDKALKSFDKKKIWEEIKTADRTDPSSLLVSHNRRGDQASEGNGQRNRQDALAWNEPVLSPTRGTNTVDEPSEPASTPNELSRLRGTLLQRDMDLSRIKEENEKWRGQTTLLEALLGVEVTSAGEEAWNVTLYESWNAHSEARRATTTAAPRKGALTISIGTSESTGKLRYLGPVQGQSDAAVLQRLPAQYHNEMGLKPETASLFMRRIKDAIQTTS